MLLYSIEDLRSLGTGTAVTVGMFDGVHLGHQHIVQSLKRVASQHSLLPTVLTFRNHPRSVVHPDSTFPLLMTLDERIEYLDKLGVAAVVTLAFDEHLASLSACEFAADVLCDRLDMRLLMLGYDNQFGSRQRNDFAMLPRLGQDRGFEIEHDTPVEVDSITVSSTKVRHALTEGDVALAARMMGHRYSLRGQVVQGRHVGTTLGYPTANIVPDEPAKLIPGQGVYALQATVARKA